MKQTYLLILLFIGIQSLLYSQESIGFKKEIGFKVGFSINSINDQRFATSTKTDFSPVLAFEYIKYNSKKRENLTLAFKYGRTTSSGLLNFKWLNPEVNYTYERKHGNVWLGGFFNSFTLLNFPLYSGGQFNNNPISYTVSHGLGPSITYDHSLGNNDKWSFNSSVQVSLINYVIRPAYAHPYPEAFLDENNFDPTQKGMAKSFIKSGHLLTVNKYQKINIVLGLGYYHNNDYKVSLSYRFGIDNNLNGHHSFLRSSEFMLGFSILK